MRTEQDDTESPYECEGNRMRACCAPVLNDAFNLCHTSHTTYLIVSYLIVSYLILSYLIVSYLIYLILSHRILSYLILSATLYDDHSREEPPLMRGNADIDSRNTDIHSWVVQANDSVASHVGDSLVGDSLVEDSLDGAPAASDAQRRTTQKFRVNAKDTECARAASAEGEGGGDGPSVGQHTETDTRQEKRQERREQRHHRQVARGLPAGKNSA